MRSASSSILKHLSDAIWRERLDCEKIIRHAYTNPRLQEHIDNADWELFCEDLADILFDRPDPRQMEISGVRS